MRSDTPPGSGSSGDSAHAATQATTCDTLAVDWDLSTVDETTLVTARVTNTLEHPRQVRIDNRLDGPVSPPRRRGVPEANEALNWDADGASVSVAPGETVSVGYACQAPPQTPPVTVDDGADVSDPDPVERALCSLGDHAPPRAALPADADSAAANPLSEVDATHAAERAGDSADAVEAEVEATDETENGSADETPSRSEPTPAGPILEGPNAERRPTPAADSSVSPPAATAESDDLPHTVTAWFGAVEARLETAAKLSTAVDEATPVIASLGGRVGLATLAATMQSDEEALRRVAEQATVLADRLEETDVPTVETAR